MGNFKSLIIQTFVEKDIEDLMEIYEDFSIFNINNFI